MTLALDLLPSLIESVATEASSVLAKMLRAKDKGNVANTRFEPMLDTFLLDLGQ